MDNGVIVELVEEKKELDKDSDSEQDIEKQIFEQQMSVKDPNIPEGLKTPENSQNRIYKINSKKNSSKLILDNDSLVKVKIVLEVLQLIYIIIKHFLIEDLFQSKKGNLSLF